VDRKQKSGVAESGRLFGSFVFDFRSADNEAINEAAENVEGINVGR
jgi:hypothetical protein